MDCTVHVCIIRISVCLSAADGVVNWRDYRKVAIFVFIHSYIAGDYSPPFLTTPSDIRLQLRSLHTIGTQSHSPIHVSRLRFSICIFAPHDSPSLPSSLYTVSC